MIARSDKRILNIYELFEEQAITIPARTAIKDNDNVVTYSELEARITTIANCLSQQLDAEKIKFVGICMEPGIDIVATIFAILKAGFAYVPIDPEYPAERINYIIDDAGLMSVVTNVKTLNALKEKSKYNSIHSSVFTCLESLPRKISQASNGFSRNDLAYVIYTSGSTGKPKGVMVSHQNVLNYAAWVQNYLNLNEKEIFDCSSSFSFDLTVTVSIIPLLYGSSIIICDEKTKKTPESYLKYLQVNNISVIKLTPSYFNLLCDFIDRFHLISLKKIILGGENISIKYVKKWLSQFPLHSIINEYGPTETTVGVTQAIIDSANIHALKYAPLGSPGIGVELKVLDKNKMPVLTGEIGELYVLGNCVTRGYLNRDELTQERFINLGQQGISCKMLAYKTGDLVRFHGAVDQLEYVGRIDEQIKLRGYRIELGEIENQLLNFNGIKLASVVYRKNGDYGDLVAYYVPEKDIILDSGMLKKFLQSVLPEYMVPSLYVELKEAALTVHGKLDKASLPDINSVKSKQNAHLSLYTQYTHLSTHLYLKKIWSNLVSLNEVDLSANFCDIGGNSLTLVRFCKQLNDEGFNISVMDLFYYPTLETLAKYIDCHKGKNVAPACKIGEKRDYMFRQKKIEILCSLSQECC